MAQVKTCGQAPSAARSVCPPESRTVRLESAASWGPAHVTDAVAGLNLQEGTPLRVCVVGLGYVGLVTAASLAEWGNEVVGVEASPTRLGDLLDGRMPIFEPGLESLVRSNREAGRLRFAASEDMADAVAGARVVMLAVGTHDGNGGWQTDTIAATIEQVLPLMPGTATMAIRSTLPPDYVAELARWAPARVALQGGPSILLNPEFTREGTAIRDFMRPERVVIGVVTDEAGSGRRALNELYRSSEAPIIELPAVDAAVGKLAANLFLATKISFANELAGICDGYGADVDNVVATMSYDHRIGGSFLRPGVGFGGSCLPHQLTMTLLGAQALEIHTPLLAAVKQINEFQPRRVIITLAKALPRLRGSRIAMLGLTFKPETDDLREAPALKVARHLMAADATVVAYDPMPVARERAGATLPGLVLASSAMAAISGADAVVLTTEWQEFRDLDWAAAAGTATNAVVVDGRNALDPSAMTRAGWTYHGFGRETAYPVGAAVPVTTGPPDPGALAAIAEVALGEGFAE